ncbi:MAG TPA: family 1 glycosylhydrolase, partial [Puia sp.]
MPVKHPPCNPEIWGGIECTITRIGDTYRDQLSLSGHYSRSSDIDELADLGIRTIRYPLLWERQQPDLATAIDWSWPDTRLAALRDRQMTPIVGLLHHGSGPAFTQLDDPGFAEHFAAYAGAVAARYPWIENYTPINEPLTTARFCGLYGLWHPHQRSAVEFLNMMLNQMKGIVAAMKAIRKINPAAKLVQTEDLAKTHSKPSLAYQADFENQRRWLTFDILCGKVDPSHPLWEYLLYAGIEADRLFYFVENPCIPDILGINYYVTSERYLDDEVQQYACETHGGNGRHAYADVEAVRVFEQDGLSVLLRELDDRYDLPIALTEVHLNCTRE